MLNLAAMHTGDAHRVMWYATHKVAGAIKWVDDPGVLRVFIPRYTAFFAQEAMLWVGFIEVVKNFFLCRDVDVGDVICCCLVTKADPIHIVGGTHDQVSRFAGGAQCHGGGRFHVVSRPSKAADHNRGRGTRIRLC